MDRLNLCIWFETTKVPWGGSNQFLSALVKELTRMGHQVSHLPNPHQTQIVLINAFLNAPGRYICSRQIAQLKQTGRVTKLGKWIPQFLWLLQRRRGPILVHRLDGIAELYRGQRSKADAIQPVVNQLTDYTIFQSIYCRESFAQHGIRPPRSSLIYNGVDPSIFYPPARGLVPSPVSRLVAVSWSNNPRKGFATLAQFSRIPGIEIRFVGHWSPSIDPARVILMGIKSSLELAQIMRQSHAMIHAAENEPCSNTIVEALACGLPVLFRDSGGNRELAGNYGVALTDDLEADIQKLRTSYNELRDKILVDRPRFLISRAAQEYVKVFQQALDLD